MDAQAHVYIHHNAMASLIKARTESNPDRRSVFQATLDLAFKDEIADEGRYLPRSTDGNSREERRLWMILISLELIRF